jgi:hypothetical protein
VNSASMRSGCPGCGAGLTSSSLQAQGWERSPYGDEFSDELHRCPDCGAWSLVSVVDRFCGPDEVKVSGPLSEQEAEEQRQRLKG